MQYCHYWEFPLSEYVPQQAWEAASERNHASAIQLSGLPAKFPAALFLRISLEPFSDCKQHDVAWKIEARSLLRFLDGPLSQQSCAIACGIGRIPPSPSRPRDVNMGPINLHGAAQPCHERCVRQLLQLASTSKNV